MITRAAILSLLASSFPRCAGLCADELVPTREDGTHARAAWEAGREEAEKILREAEAEGLVESARMIGVCTWDWDGPDEGREWRLTGG